MVLLAAALVAMLSAREATAASDDGSCADCHASRTLGTTFPSGQFHDLFVKEKTFLDSVHGEAGLSCTDCHWGYDEVPHPAEESRTRREYEVGSAEVCQTCHFDQAKEWEAGEHARVLSTQNLQSATCTDCHGAHDAQPARSLQGQGLDASCASCHEPLVREFEGSIHGQALLAGDPAAPSCSTCHDPHTTEPVGTAAYRVQSVGTCVSCHEDTSLAEGHGINPDVVNTYFDEFHGRSLRLTMATQPGEWVAQAVCTDCHGVHGILPPDDPHAQVAPENLVATCSQCHPGATSNFVASFGGHVPPERSTLVRAIELFYQIVIPVSVAGFVLFAVLDGARRFRERRRVGR
ncbi:formate dehydrogenase cytochrome b subunit [Limnochorda pilosa]|uniref:Formate dehydrogenase cytochrome b subunit n=1 Tax=Limnochorda pilosa TaxID=1555112 RepID=A0A0K2SG35_LIMPI|nr:formate dehydrogenase cytochrome b subunit [Limnochorda pilosa]